MRRPELWLVVLWSASLLAWALLALDASNLLLPGYCSAVPGRATPASASVVLGMAYDLPMAFAFFWALMVVAMMFPLLTSPLQHLFDRSFAQRRARSMLLFIAAYVMIWMSAGMALELVGLGVQWLMPRPPGSLGLAGITAILWQVSPAKQSCLNRCHRRPPLAAFGAVADRDAFVFGLSTGLSCIGACWAVMLLPLIMGRAHILGMLAVTVFVGAERLERPASLSWRWRFPVKALRIARAKILCG